ncbi:WD repeat-containing protein 43-like [Asparagus officinalis]|uniref:WD repeat-containing protein 43-like n=1 Tax=Asparagus officinalis TaxID=4686 RepID=UPI00098E53C2|nr:WD repeat-containing protein 43-like [Asparagus officinalis]
MTTEEMETMASSKGAGTEEEQLKKIKKQKNKKKKEKTDVEEGQEGGNLDTDGKRKKNKSKKRSAPALDSQEERCINAGVTHKVDDEYDVNEPTMAEKLASLDLVNEDKSKNVDKQEPSPIPTPPSADSVHRLLKQALHADDHALLLDCLYSRDEKVIAKSTSLLSPVDVLKLLKSLTSMVQQRGAVLICALPWLRSLLCQQASSIASQESSLHILNSLYQLIEARVSTFRSALQLSTSLDVLCARMPEVEAEEDSTIPLIIYEDKDSSEEEAENEDAMETDEVDGEDLGAIIDSHDSDGSEVMSD